MLDLVIFYLEERQNTRSASPVTTTPSNKQPIHNESKSVVVMLSFRLVYNIQYRLKHGFKINAVMQVKFLYFMVK